MRLHTVIYRLYAETSIGPTLYKDFDTLEEACIWGSREFSRSENFDAYLRLPSGRVMAFTKMWGLV